MMDQIPSSQNQNIGLRLGRVNYQTHAAKLTQDWKHVHMAFKGTYIKIGKFMFL